MVGTNPGGLTNKNDFNRQNLGTSSNHKNHGVQHLPNWKFRHQHMNAVKCGFTEQHHLQDLGFNAHQETLAWGYLFRPEYRCLLRGGNGNPAGFEAFVPSKNWLVGICITRGDKHC
jgi:hypothetical protein